VPPQTTPRASSPCYMGGHARPSFPHFSGPSPDRTCSAVLGGAGRSGSLLLPAALCIEKVARTLIQLLCAFSPGGVSPRPLGRPP